ncbi:MAG TPA: methyltransferase domain-containing protein [Ktedonobacteraceae bacterium]|nr:methyltransferase domain-containing protein [Ktedonobacteraceae bacterium]
MSESIPFSASPLSHCDFLICPICGQPLFPSASGNALQCPRNHSFDIAREQYVNLLLKKASGDTKEMLQARRQFLKSGHYAPLSNKIDELVARYLNETRLSRLPAAADVSEHTQGSQSCISILDAGCGEGYYLGQLRRYLRIHQSELPHCYLGIDSSKEAIRMAARRYKDICFLVASIKEPLPIASDSIQVLLNIFAPRNVAEFARVLVPDGLLLALIPGPNHLQPLRDRLSLLSIEEDKQQHVIQQFASYFSLRDIITLDYRLPLDRQAIILLVRMTPNYWHLSEQARQAIEGIKEVQTKISLTCLVFVKQ